MLGCVCFGWKSLLEMLFRKWGCLVGPENRIFRKLISIDRKKNGFDYGNHFTLSFSLQSISGKRERERESERARGRRSSSSPVRRSSANPELQSALISRAPIWRPRSEITISRSTASIAIDAVLREIAIDASLDHAVDRDLATSIAISRRSWSRDVNRDLAKITISPSWDRAIDRDRRRGRRTGAREAPRRRTQSSVER